MCVKNVYGALRDYLSDRTHTANYGEVRVEVNASRGCPQGSVLGPLLWVLAMEEALGCDLRGGGPYSLCR